MCGFAGCWTGSAARMDELLQTVESMAQTLVHRGPDDSGVWADPSAGLALGFRRLAILDLSPAGHQPMASPSRRYVVVFNGEIYNHDELRRQLQGDVAFRGTSDTEVLLALVERDGVESAIRQAHGMFAIAIWDAHNRELWLARDRVGKKPLFYGHSGDTLLFGSELKALTCWPGFTRQVDRRALASFVRYGYVPSPHSIYRGIGKLLPGELLVLRERQVVRRIRYWSPPAVAADGREQRSTTELDPSLPDQLESLLRESVSQRMVADVPLGAFLSGGVDSSLVVALMQQVSARPVRTFTIGFDVPGYNEAAHAAAVARHLATDHTELYVSPDQALAIIPDLSAVYDEPFADSSQLPTLLVAQMARRHVTVCLSGDGGDEAFGGYTRYGWASSIWRWLKVLPAPARSLVSHALRAPGPKTWDTLYRLAEPLVPNSLRQSLPGDKMHKLAALLDVQSSDQLYKRLVSQWTNPATVVRDGREYATALDDPALVASSTNNFTERMMLLDLMTYLPDDILVKVDRATMAHSLEARAPLLDHRVLEWAWRLPLEAKVRDGQRKWLLRQVLYRYVPPALIDRPKMGFGVPIDTWLRGPLRSWAEELLAPERLAQEGFFEPAPVTEAWHAHLSGARNEHYRLWTILTFQAWLARWGAVA